VGKRQLLVKSCGQPDKRVHVALPLRVTYFHDNVKTGMDMACTYDIYSHGARITGLRHAAAVGQVVMIERGRSKALCRISWIADPQSELRGQFGIECIEPEKVPWKLELEELQELYRPFEFLGRATRNFKSQERRHAPRFAVQGVADLVTRRARTLLEAQMRDISENGCRVLTPASVETGAEVELNLNISDWAVTLRGEVRHAGTEESGILFRTIRHGDRPLLEYLLRSAAGHDAENAKWNFELATG
jgi:hypothetical protein